MNSDFFVDFAFSTLFTLLRATIKNVESKAKYKKVLLKLRNQINTAFSDDPDFNS